MMTLDQVLPYEQQRDLEDWTDLGGYMPPMDPHAKALWVEALRSGRYAQYCGGELRRQDDDAPKDALCALGVLCEVFRLDTGRGMWTGETFAVDSETPYSTCGYVPRSVAAWAGIPAILKGNPLFEWEGRPTTIVTVNDSEELPFDRIADLIEEHL